MLKTTLILPALTLFIVSCSSQDSKSNETESDSPLPKPVLEAKKAAVGTVPAEGVTEGAGEPAPREAMMPTGKAEKLPGAACIYGGRSYSRSYSAKHMAKNTKQSINKIRATFSQNCESVTITAALTGRSEKLVYENDYFAEGMFIADDDRGNVVAVPGVYDDKLVVYLKWRDHVVLGDEDDAVSLSSGSDDDNFRLVHE